MPLGTKCSLIEVLPLVLSSWRSIQQHRLFRLGLWNFVSTGVFGGVSLNAPPANYYEHGTFLTLNHAHTALFGAFGMLALGLI